MKAITEKEYDLIELRIEEFLERTKNYHDVDVEDVLFSYFKATDDTFFILNDWDEGKGNDPFWDEERDMHSAIAFIKDVCTELGRDTAKWN